MTQTHSKRHRAIELALAGEAYLPSTGNVLSVDGGKAQPFDKYGGNLAIVIEGMDLYAKAPTFVISESVCKMLEGRMHDLQKSLLDLREADLLSLPFPAMNIEFEYRTPNDRLVRAIVHLSDLHDPDIVAGFRHALQEYDMNDTTKLSYNSFNALLNDKKYDVLVDVLRIEKDEDGEYLVVSPNYTFIGMHRGADGEPWVQSASRQYGHYTPSPVLDYVSKIVQQRDAHLALYAFICATLVYNTQGIERERIDCEKLNKKRKASGKPSIAQHHYLYIDRVYRSSATEDTSSERYDERKHPRPHWRKAHVRGVRYGKGRTEIKQMKIEARIIAWNGKGPEPEKPSGTTIVKMRGKKNV